MSVLESTLAFLGDLRTQDLAWEMKKLQAIREWALEQAEIDYEVGDTVRIADFMPQKDGWWHYRECLHIGALAEVRTIDFSVYSKCWVADIMLNREWSVSEDWPRKGEQTRYWHGALADTPEGYTPPSTFDQERYPEGRRHTFGFRASRLRKVVTPPTPGDERRAK